MRAAWLVSTLAFLAGSPALAQCMYVACQGGAQNASTYQQPIYAPHAAQMPAPGASQNTASGYNEGYAAGLAARPAAPRAARRTTHSHRAAPVRAQVPVRARATTSRSHAAPATKRRTTVAATRSHVAPVAKRRPAAPTHATTTRATSTPHQARAQAPRRAVAAQRAPQRAARTNMHTHTSQTYRDPIKDRAATYRPPVYGQSTTMASMMSRASTTTTTTSWTGPATLVRQGAQVCGWGAKIVTNSQGYAQRQAVWVCQCPQGWRPPGY